jgi:hypothetical protein
MYVYVRSKSRASERALSFDKKSRQGINNRTPTMAFDEQTKCVRGKRQRPELSACKRNKSHVFPSQDIITMHAFGNMPGRYMPTTRGVGSGKLLFFVLSIYVPTSTIANLSIYTVRTVCWSSSEKE